MLCDVVAIEAQRQTKLKYHEKVDLKSRRELCARFVGRKHVLIATDLPEYFLINTLTKR
jgi:hypothetical protein